MNVWTHRLIGMLGSVGGTKSSLQLSSFGQLFLHHLLLQPLALFALLSATPNLKKISLII
jgi:hypothetical protein